MHFKYVCLAHSLSVCQVCEIHCLCISNEYPMLCYIMVGISVSISVSISESISVSLSESLFSSPLQSVCMCIQARCIPLEINQQVDQVRNLLRWEGGWVGGGQGWVGGGADAMKIFRVSWVIL